MIDTIERKAVELSEALKNDLNDIEKTATAFTLADAIREGSSVTSQACGWGDGESACALTAAVISAKARGLV